MRSRALAFGCLLLGGGLALVGSAQPWWRAVGEGVVVKFSGTQATGGLSQALAVVALAGTLLMLALRTRGRRVTGALLLLVGAGIAVVGGLRQQPSADSVRSQVREVSLVDAFHLSATVWPWVFALSGVLVAAGAVLTMTTAGTWPSGSDRFQPGSGKAVVSASDDPADLWKAMDVGVDPTTDARPTENTDASVGNRAPPHGGEASGGVLPLRATTTAADSPRDARAAGNIDDHETAKVPDPDVRDRAAGDTMENTGRQEPEA
jgi:uncharacterized membrane protein (TIGR02234 family)